MQRTGRGRRVVVRAELLLARRVVPLLPLPLLAPRRRRRLLDVDLPQRAASSRDRHRGIQVGRTTALRKSLAEMKQNTTLTRRAARRIKARIVLAPDLEQGGGVGHGADGELEVHRVQHALRPGRPPSVSLLYRRILIHGRWDDWRAVSVGHRQCLFTW